jgi:hypothetical protein
MDGKEVARARKDNPRRKIFDWISEPRPDSITPFQKFIVDLDWEKSPLGPMTQWPAQLRQMVLLVVQDPSPAGECSCTSFLSLLVPDLNRKITR